MMVHSNSSDSQADPTTICTHIYNRTLVTGNNSNNNNECICKAHNK